MEKNEIQERVELLESAVMENLKDVRYLQDRINEKEQEKRSIGLEIALQQEKLEKCNKEIEEIQADLSPILDTVRQLNLEILSHLYGFNVGEVVRIIDGYAPDGSFNCVNGIIEGYSDDGSTYIWRKIARSSKRPLKKTDLLPLEKGPIKVADCYEDFISVTHCYT